MLALLGCFLISHSMNGLPLETNILKLLPNATTDPLTEEAYRKFETASGRKTVFMVGGESLDKTRTAAELLHLDLVDSGLFSEVSYKVDPERARKTYEVYLPHRQSLLSQEQRQALSGGQPERIVSQAMKSLMSPISAGSANLANDPLFTFTEFLKELQGQGMTLSIEEDVLIGQLDDRQFVIIIGVLKDNAFSMAAQVRFSQFFEAAKRSIDSQFPGTDILSAGVIHHAIAGTNSARHDISTIGVGSLLGLLVLMLVAFRSLGPLLASAVPILAGCLAALTVSVIIFDKVHLFTLVFGSSLIGVSIDYSFHYLSERLSAGESWDPKHGLSKIFPGITLGLLTSVAAYLSMAIAPFSGLQQIAVFSTVGLIAAYLTVVLWYPVMLFKPTASYRPPTLRLSERYVTSWSRLQPRIVGLISIAACGVMLVFVTFKLPVDDDIRALQDSPPSVLREENLVKEIVGTNSGSQFFVVQGAGENEVLAREEALTTLLDQQISAGSLSRYRAISKVLPSPTRQRENYSLLRKQILDPESPLSQYFQEMEFEDRVVLDYRRSFEAEEMEPLEVPRWLESPIGELYADLWIEGKDGGQASIVILDEVRDLNSLREVGEQLDNVTFVSRADDVSQLLQRYRELSTWLVAGAYLAIFGLLLYRYSRGQALKVIAPPLVAGLVALTATAALGIALNLFNTLALVLALGIGIDYTIFFAEKPEHRATTMHAIFLSAVTTILSFGLLALSGTPVISSFGLVVLVGIAVSLLLSPAAGME